MFLKIQKILNKLVKSDCWSHGGFDVEGPDVLPLLLQQRNQEIDGHVDVLDQLIVVHVDITDGDGQAQNFFHLEFDGLFHFFDFGNHIVSLGQNGWKLTGFVQTWSQQSRNLSDQSIGSQECVVFFGEFFLTNFLSLLSFFKSSTDMCGMLCLMASSIWAWLPRTQTVNFGRAVFGSLTVPENRLSFCGS